MWDEFLMLSISQLKNRSADSATFLRPACITRLIRDNKTLTLVNWKYRGSCSEEAAELLHSMKHETGKYWN